MKSNSLRPGFQIIFSAAVIACIILPLMVFAQEPHQFKVTITNDDTIVNGKKMKGLSAAEHTDVLNKIKHFKESPGKVSIFNLKMKTKGKDTLAGEIVQEMIIDAKPMANYNFVKPDSTSGFNMDHKDELGDRSFRLSQGNIDKDRIHNWSLVMDRRRPFLNGRRNSQIFNYASADKNGIINSVTFAITDADKETLKQLINTEKTDLIINDLMISPSFSTGKTNLSFALAEKGNAEVQLKDNDGKVLWTDKTIGNFYKSFVLPQNSIYYLQVKQGNKIALRVILKEQ